MNLINDFLIKKYIKIALNTYHSEATFHGDKCNLRCNICGDSAKSKHKRRGHFLDYKDKYRFKCFNCGISILATTWLKKYYPEYYQQYIQELLMMNNTDEPKAKKTKAKKKNESKDMKFFKSIRTDIPLSRLAYKVCKSRKLPLNVFKKWYVATDGRYRDRLIIPIYDNKNKIVYWQGRALKDQDPKYLNCYRSTDDAILAQLSCVDVTRPIIIVEGYIDSLFIKNSVATMSTNWSSEVQDRLDNLNCYYLIDFDDGNKQVQKRQIALLKNNQYVFNWHKYLKDQHLEVRAKWDINELYSYFDKDSNFDFSDFKKWFTNDYLDKIYFN